MKIVIAGIVGGVILFVCGALFHIVTPLGHAGVAAVPQDRELPLIEAMKSMLTERKVYMFPGFDMDDSGAMEKEPFRSRHDAGPTGIIVFSPGPGVWTRSRLMLFEFGFNVLEGLIAAFVVAQMAASATWGRRALVVALIGLSGTIASEGSLWNWYLFPTEYFGAYLVMNTVGALIAGFAIAKIVPPRA